MKEASPGKKLDALIPSPEHELFEPKIKGLVQAINSLEVVTFWSCEGHTEMSKLVIGSHIPKIAINLEHSSAEGLIQMFKLVGLFNQNNRRIEWVFIPYENYLKLQPRTDNPPLQELQSNAVELGKFILKNAKRKL